MSDAAEVRQFAIDEFDQRYAALRLQATRGGPPGNDSIIAPLWPDLAAGGLAG